MKRRDVLKAAAAVGTVAAATTTSSLPAPAVAQGIRRLNMVTAWPPKSPGLGTSAERMAERITTASEGKLQVKVFAAGELVPAFEAFDAVSAGTAEMYHAAEYYWQGKSKAFAFFTAVPFGLTGPETYAWIHFGGGQQLWEELSAQFGVKPLLAATSGVQMGGWLNKEIKVLDDLKGLKFRMPGIGGEVLRRLGAVVVNVPGGEIFAAMASGAIDGTELVGPWIDLAFGLYKVADHYYWPGFHEPGACTSVALNMGVWESLTREQQMIVRMAVEAEATLQTAEYSARNIEALPVLLGEHKVKLRRFPDELMIEFGRVSGEVVSEIGNSDPLAKRVYESFIAYRKHAIGWSRISEQAYMNARLLPFDYG